MPWSMLRAKGALQTALGRTAGCGRVYGDGVTRGQHGNGPYISMHFASAAVPANSRSFSKPPGTSELTLQELNRRLALYMDQVHSLEEANEKLEKQIQELLDRKCPSDLRELDRHLKTVDMLQAQISDCLSDQAQVKLELVNAELDVFDLNVKCEQVQKQQKCWEADLRDAKLIKEELSLHRLPDLHLLLASHTEELNRLHRQHQQDVKERLAHLSWGFAVEMQCTESSSLNQQLEDLRQNCITLVTESQTNTIDWFNTKVSALSSKDELCSSSVSKVSQAEFSELQKTRVSLEQKLVQFQSQNMLLENMEVELREGYRRQLIGLQQRAGALGEELDSVLQAVGQRSSEHQALLNIKTRLETEIEDYRKLLNGQSHSYQSSCPALADHRGRGHG
ncbi:keratin, type I cytoskeletal 14-like [Lampris incognitus]|uniref:keratin, type I cytoskeletal 14-like n=1 Tax=Lampris incognitus TaxID=2546036 RepID=UPI0024B5A888|nr:keratin, type I cytoskeletal 14-like [Lampris incognitus]